MSAGHRAEPEAAKTNRNVPLRGIADATTRASAPPAEGERVWGPQIWNPSLAVGPPQIDLGDRDLLAIRNALSEALRELGIEEFDTRVGVSFEEAQSVLARLDEILRTTDDRS